MLKRNLPFFSIIIPTYARPKQLASCLQAIALLDYPSDRFEVIVVDDGSPESKVEQTVSLFETERKMEEVVAPFHNKLDIKLISQPNAGPATARNTGAAHAKGEFLAFTDDDCEPDSSWLQALATSFATLRPLDRLGAAQAQGTAQPDMSRGVPRKRGRDQMVGGQVVNALSENLFSTATQLLMNYLYDYYNDVPDQARFFTSNNLALPTAHFKELGGFDTTFPLAAGEDREFCDRWLHHGYRMSYAPQAVVYHAHALSLASFWRQHFHYGCGTFNYRHLRAQRRQESVKVERMAFYLNLLCYPLSQRKGKLERLSLPRALLLVALMFISQVANTFGFFWEMINLATKKEAPTPSPSPNTRGGEQKSSLWEL